MSSLKDSIKTIINRVVHLWHPQVSAPVVDSAGEEQTEQEERVDLLINPLQGVMWSSIWSVDALEGHRLPALFLSLTASRSGLQKAFTGQLAQS